MKKEYLARILAATLACLLQANLKRRSKPMECLKRADQIKRKQITIVRAMMEPTRVISIFGLTCGVWLTTKKISDQSYVDNVLPEQEDGAVNLTSHRKHIFGIDFTVFWCLALRHRKLAFVRVRGHLGDNFPVDGRGLGGFEEIHKEQAWCFWIGA